MSKQKAPAPTEAQQSAAEMQPKRRPENSTNSPAGSSPLFIRLRIGLIEPKHIAAIGPSIWVYLHMLKMADWENGSIDNWTDASAAKTLGLPLETLRDHRQQLQRAGYISSQQGLHCLKVTLAKWRNPRIKHDDAVPSPYGDGHDDAVPSPYAIPRDVTMYPYSELSTQNKQNVGRGAKNAPLPPARKRASRGAAAPEVRKFIALFEQLTGLKYQHSNSRTWEEPAARMLAGANGSSDVVLPAALERAHKRDLTISSPKSIESVFAAVLAIKQSGGGRRQARRIVR